MTLASVDQVIH